MLIDWFTVFAQIINFLILVLLLKHFLYGRIIEAMDAREAGIAKKAQQAEEHRRRAQDEARSLEDKVRSFDADYQERLKTAKLEVRDLKAQQIRLARNEVGALREQWGEALNRQQSEFVHELKRRSGEELCEIARRALGDLADVELEAQVVGAFTRKLIASCGGNPALHGALENAPGAITISSSFPISSEQQRELVQHLQTELLGDRPVQFEEDPELSCGVVLRANSHVVEWSLDAYVDELAERFQEAIAAESHGASRAADLDEQDNPFPEDPLP